MENKPTIPLIKGSSTFKMIIPAEVERQIRFLCERVWSTEWSGVLFYTYEGGLEDGSLKIICKDIYPMDIGSTTYTEFSMSPDVIGYMASNTELLDCKMGLIHSHNNMSTFFSGTDQSTLQEEGAERNHFVSLIVNNAGKYTAAITRKIKYKKSITFNYEGFNGLIKVKSPTITEGEAIEYFYLDIEMEGETDNTAKSLADRLEEIKKKKPAAPTNLNNTFSGYKGWESYADYLKRTESTQNNKNPEPTYKTPSLFSKEEEEENYDFWTSKKNKPGALYLNKEDEKKESSFSEKITPEAVNSIVAQLLTGSVAVTDIEKVKEPGWLGTMTKLFNKRFGKDHDGDLLFEFWAEDFIQFLLTYSIDDSDVADPDALTSELADAVMEKLTEFPANEYIDIYIGILARFI